MGLYYCVKRRRYRTLIGACKHSNGKARLDCEDERVNCQPAKLITEGLEMLGEYLSKKWKRRPKQPIGSGRTDSLQRGRIGEHDCACSSIERRH